MLGAHPVTSSRSNCKVYVGGIAEKAELDKVLREQVEPLPGFKELNENDKWEVVSRNEGKTYFVIEFENNYFALNAIPLLTNKEDLQVCWCNLNPAVSVGGLKDKSKDELEKLFSPLEGLIRNTGRNSTEPYILEFKNIGFASKAIPLLSFNRKHLGLFQKKNDETITGIRLFAECQMICRVFLFEHSANKVFTECQTKNTRQRASLPSVLFFSTLGKEASLPSVFYRH